jgi:hypothetical protein
MIRSYVLQKNVIDLCAHKKDDSTLWMPVGDNTSICAMVYEHKSPGHERRQCALCVEIKSCRYLAVIYNLLNRILLLYLFYYLVFRINQLLFWARHCATSSCMVWYVPKNQYTYSECLGVISESSIINIFILEVHQILHK